jgi:hypothetical protein
MRKFLFLSVLLLVNQVFAQTNFQGGIYNNTTWTEANSPYHITGNVVIFPGKTLTIEPGVQVIVDADLTFNMGNYISLEVRGNLIAQGTINAPIIFTSTDIFSGSNWLGINVKKTQGATISMNSFQLTNSYYGIYADDADGLQYNFENCIFKDNQYTFQMNSFLNFNNCIFQRNGVGVAMQLVSGGVTASNSTFSDNFCAFTTLASPLQVSNCTFSNNVNTIIQCSGTIDSCNFLNNENGLMDVGGFTITNSQFYSNMTGISNISGSSIANCDFAFNGVALRLGDACAVTNSTFTENTVGIAVTGNNINQVVNNQICNNTQYNIQNLTDKNFSINANCFCETDSTTIENLLFDGYDDITRGLMNYAIYDDSCSAIVTYVTKIDLDEPASLSELTNDFQLFQSEDNITIQAKNTINSLQLINAMGQVILATLPNKNTFSISTTNYSSGIYLLMINDVQKRIFLK